MKVSIEEIIEMELKASVINSAPLEDIEWTFNDQPIEVPKDKVEDWKFTGLSNKDFVRFMLIDNNGEVIQNEK